MGKFISVLISLLILGGTSPCEAIDLSVYKTKMIAVAKKVAFKFNYYDEISSSIPNFYQSKSEIGGQCGDYALAFVNLWNAKFPQKALLVIQQQGIKQFPDGIYEVIGKDQQNLPFLKGRTTSMLYVWNNVLGIGHPKLGSYKIRLIKKAYVKSHFGLKNWNKNGPHVWVLIDNIGIDPTYADFGTFPIVGRDVFK